MIELRWSLVQRIAHLLCECDGKSWASITTAERDRYGRIAVLIHETIVREIAAEDGAETLPQARGDLS